MSVDCSSLDGEVVSMAAGGSFTAFLTCQSHSIPKSSMEI